MEGKAHNLGWPHTKFSNFKHGITILLEAMRII